MVMLSALDHPLLIQKDSDCSICKTKYVSNYLFVSVIRRITIWSLMTSIEPSSLKKVRDTSQRNLSTVSTLGIWGSAASLSPNHDEHKIKLYKGFWLNR